MWSSRMKAMIVFSGHTQSGVADTAMCGLTVGNSTCMCWYAGRLMDQLQHPSTKQRIAAGKAISVAALESTFRGRPDRKTMPTKLPTGQCCGETPIQDRSL